MISWGSYWWSWLYWLLHWKRGFWLQQSFLERFLWWVWLSLQFLIWPALWCKGSKDSRGKSRRVVIALLFHLRLLLRCLPPPQPCFLSPHWLASRKGKSSPCVRSLGKLLPCALPLGGGWGYLVTGDDQLPPGRVWHHGLSPFRLDICSCLISQRILRLSLSPGHSACSPGAQVVPLSLWLFESHRFCVTCWVKSFCGLFASHVPGMQIGFTTGSRVFCSLGPSMVGHLWLTGDHSDPHY